MNELLKEISDKIIIIKKILQSTTKNVIIPINIQTILDPVYDTYLLKKINSLLLLKEAQHIASINKNTFSIVKALYNHERLDFIQVIFIQRPDTFKKLNVTNISDLEQYKNEFYNKIEIIQNDEDFIKMKNVLNIHNWCMVDDTLIITNNNNNVKLNFPKFFTNNVSNNPRLIMFALTKNSPIKKHFNIDTYFWYINNEINVKKQNINTIKEKFDYVIISNNDGDSLYRSTIYSLFISILYNSDRDLQEKWCKHLRKNFFNDEVFNNFFEQFNIIITHKLSFLLFTILYSIYDLLFIIFCRNNIILFLNDNKTVNININKTNIKNISLSKKDYNIQYILSFIIGFTKINIVEISKDILLYNADITSIDNYEQLKNRFIPSNFSDILPEVNLLHNTKNNHYDILLSSKEKLNLNISNIFKNYKHN